MNAVTLCARGGRMVIVGDLHGQLQDMEQTLRAYGGPSEWAPERKLVLARHMGL